MTPERRFYYHSIKVEARNYYELDSMLNGIVREGGRVVNLEHGVGHPPWSCIVLVELTPAEEDHWQSQAKQNNLMRIDR